MKKPSYLFLSLLPGFFCPLQDCSSRVIDTDIQTCSKICLSWKISRKYRDLPSKQQVYELYQKRSVELSEISRITVP